ncbi:MAG TPA: hypothetical protein VFI78_03710 [Salinimicrobium sp.]|nr:hypothetical protein [Salinimicrobium sp.]
MIRTLAIIILILGGLSLIFGIFGIFGDVSLIFSPYALTILGVVLFIVGFSMLKSRKDTDEV